MRTIEILMIALAMIAATCFADVTYTWDDLPPECVLEDQGDEIYLICIPETWNNNVVVYTRSFVIPDNAEPIDPPYFPIEAFINPVDEAYLWNTIMSMDYALISTSYSAYPFEIDQCYEDTLNLINNFLAVYDAEDIIMLGSGIGGLTASKFCSEEPDLVIGCIAIDSALGSFQGMLNHLSDVATVLNYFYPELIFPGIAGQVSGELFNDWFSSDEYQTEIKEALLSDYEKMEEIFSILDMPYDDDDDDENVEDEIDSFLNTFSLYVSLGYDMQNVWGCSPFSNVDTHYTGSADNRCFNKRVVRYDTDCPDGTVYDASVNFIRPVFAVASTMQPSIPNSDSFALLEKLINVEDPLATYPLTLISTNTLGFSMVSSRFIQTVIEEVENAATLC